MDIPRFWVRAHDPAFPTLRPWGWSAVDRDRASRHAEERLSAIRAAFLGKRSLDHYPYGVRPLREEIVQEIPGPDGVSAAVVTRNGLGTLVLNACGLLFVDVDVPAPGGWHKLLMWFGLRSKTPADGALARIRCGLATRPEVGFRIYRTAGGFRVLATNRTFDPRADETAPLMTACGVDPHYLRLCKAQNSFRARLTPKPWRCGLPPVPGTHPRSESQAEPFARWSAAYDTACRGYGTCRFLETVGPDERSPELAGLIRLHDATSRADEDLPLA